MDGTIKVRAAGAGGQLRPGPLLPLCRPGLSHPPLPPLPPLLPSVPSPGLGGSAAGLGGPPGAARLGGPAVTAPGSGLPAPGAAGRRQGGGWGRRGSELPAPGGSMSAGSDFLAWPCPKRAAGSAGVLPLAVLGGERGTGRFGGETSP